MFFFSYLFKVEKNICESVKRYKCCTFQWGIVLIASTANMGCYFMAIVPNVKRFTYILTQF